jgi:4-amino-4-deoxy-L-arabinose transferase-like glycosyltransferase
MSEEIIGGPMSLRHLFVARLRDLPKEFTAILFFSLLIKLALSALLPLTSDEAYYWVWSHHPQLSYFDHPPAIAWLFWLTHPIENFGSASRWAGVILSQMTIVLWLVLLRPYLNNRQLRIWLWLSLLSPLVGAGGLLITPDIPLLFFWSLTLFVFVEWLRQPSPVRSMLLGLACGLGFCSKYVMVLEPMFLFFGCFAIKEWRTPALKNWYWIIMGVIAGSAPVLAWNYSNDFASFRFQAQHGLGHDFYKPNWTYSYVLGQIGLIFPPVLYWAVRGTKKAPPWLALLAWGPLLFFVITSFKGSVEANWPIVSYFGVFALAALYLDHFTLGLKSTLAFWSFVLVAIFGLITTRWSPTGEPIKTKEFFEFNVLETIASQHDPIFARSYQMASKLSFEMKRQIPKLKFMNRRDYYDFQADSEPTGALFYVLVERTDRLPEYYLKEGYKIVGKTPVSDTGFDLWEVRK